MLITLLVAGSPMVFNQVTEYWPPVGSLRDAPGYKINAKAGGYDDKPE